ncbi:uncharacterized protein EI97DRAFT_429699 [Westerdykella ornata]|uniref:Uncharacterized protein n=1 Tax=Westerdykella ornata TaxID=318751 RepID=A0A6A6JTI2_WESOR|nr:uncharacterized protein EI97DRAFT_429699 [Westerdykella ornata]KAF2279930.1 hypothetical protein EI97DRAFT_429699 [Westerdykella ornata]
MEVISPTTSNTSETLSRRLSRIPRELDILPQPLAVSSLPVGQLVSPSAKLNTSVLADRDFIDVGDRFYKDVVLIDGKTGRFKESLGGVRLIEKPAPGDEVGVIEAMEERIRMLKNDAEAFAKVLSRDEQARGWIEKRMDSGEEVGFVTSVREITDPRYKHAMVQETATGGMWEIELESPFSQEKGPKKRRDSGLDVVTGSNTDVVGVIVKKVVREGGDLRLSEEELGTQYWVM